MRECVVCLERERRGSAWCGPCARNYDRNACREGTVMEAMAWAAKRARYYERRRARKDTGK